MTSAPIRNPVEDHLLTPQNAALLIIDYQPVQVSSVSSRDKRQLVANIVALAKIGKLYGLPTVLASVNVKTGINQPTIHQITDVLPSVAPIDRTAINAWEDTDFVAAVKATGRKKLIMAALWTEVCLVHPALDAMKEGFEVYPVVDAVAVTGTGKRPSPVLLRFCSRSKDTNSQICDLAVPAIWRLSCREESQDGFA
jgi:nicotinamidase-related amidase